MPEHPRPARRRRTDAVLSALDDHQPWWRDMPVSRPRAKYLRFRSGDPFD
ncbi:MAG: hypothetical protein JNG86_23105, partial [Verrucomicrobiaceae bacterium]|nr:hypothetical protein [Verrucomicrobiaceae bacterium]